MLGRERDLTDGQRSEMSRAALAVIQDDRFAEVFGLGSRSEVALAGRLKGGLALSGRLDRLVLLPHRLLIVDFKTNRPAPASVRDADPAYVLQMALYVAVLREAYPDRSVEAALVWTDGPALMPVPQDMMDAAVAGLAGRSA
jgi:ATP-dependent helicase/nuclease subunit A